MSGTVTPLPPVVAPVVTKDSNPTVSAGQSVEIATVTGGTDSTIGVETDQQSVALTNDADIPAGSSVSITYSAADLASLAATQSTLTGLQAEEQTAINEGFPFSPATITQVTQQAYAMSATVVGHVMYTPGTIPSTEADTISYTLTDTVTGGTTPVTETVQLKGAASPPPSTSLTAAQIKSITADTIKFYIDEAAHRSTSADVTKLDTDLKGVNLTADNLGQVVGGALGSVLGANGTTIGTDIGKEFFPQISADITGNASGLPGDLTSMIDTAIKAGVTYAGLLLKHDTPSQALAATLSTYHLA